MSEGYTYQNNETISQILYAGDPHIFGTIDHMMNVSSEHYSREFSSASRVLIKNIFASITIYTLGTGPLNKRFPIEVVNSKALNSLEKFLDDLQVHAKDYDSGSQIGSIFILQHIKDWVHEFRCGCWPE